MKWSRDVDNWSPRSWGNSTELLLSSLINQIVQRRRSAPQNLAGRNEECLYLRVDHLKLSRLEVSAGRDAGDAGYYLGELLRAAAVELNQQNGPETLAVTEMVQRRWRSTKWSRDVGGQRNGPETLAVNEMVQRRWRSTKWSRDVGGQRNGPETLIIGAPEAGGIPQNCCCRV
ncbi:uncharacterized protein LOC131990092 isoform X3 [Centropristis striata]|uniref:uncharacterized protein LOC131990092 isoform X3 n=1 Tax=Centropristis striata TaxID=184440 RepID=UPI0027E0D0F2|nr:uncharacterized protein LOC131990092 isoform X3 [Centropristis striata]XP_059211479.1 uncharacterized protein LOC131990092 isoform X3 [Centropristis striata]